VRNSCPREAFRAGQQRVSGIEHAFAPLERVEG
jgi:hypothetical protein